jgi:hypothetical protein
MLLPRLFAPCFGACLLLSISTASGQTLFERLPPGRLPPDGLPARGVAWGDLNGDGWEDLVVGNQDSGNYILLNDEGSFLRREEEALRAYGGWTEGAYLVDIDRDDDLDIFFANNPVNHLFLNDGAAHFTFADGGDLTRDSADTRGACWCDYDRDGDLDVFVANRDGDDDQLYENDGTGRFSSVSGPWNGHGGDGRACAWGDLDSDGSYDLIVGNFVRKENGNFAGPHRNYLYFGDPDGSFREELAGPFAEEENPTYGLNLIDFDEDGDLDVYVTNVSSSSDNDLYENQGEGSFRALSDHPLARYTRRPSKGQAWADFDNNGTMDLYVANGTEDFPDIQNYLFLQDTAGSFQRIYRDISAVDPHISAGAAVADFDNDGDMDLYVCNWGGEKENNDLYVNRAGSNGYQWIKLRLQGRQSPTYGEGAWIHFAIQTEEGVTRKKVYHSRETGYASQNSPLVHLGLGAASRLIDLEVHWPAGTIDRFENVAANSYYKVTEGITIEKITR